MPKQKKNLITPPLETPEAVEPAEIQPKVEPKSKGILCQYCKRKHEKTFDKAGMINHDKFDRGGKSEIMFETLANEPTQMMFIPLAPGDIPGKPSSVYQFTRNGLRINVAKNKQVEVPKSIAEQIQESLINSSSVMYSYAKTKNLNGEGYRNARLDLLSEEEQNILSR